MWFSKTSASSTRENVKIGPIQINMNEIECLIKTAHLKSKEEDKNNNLSKHANIINMSKAFIKTVTKNPHYNEDQYILDIEVKEKKPLKKHNTGENDRNILERLVKGKRPRREYKVIDATIDPNLFSKDLITNDYIAIKKLKTLRVICLAVITENSSWKNALNSYIPFNSINYHTESENIDVKEVIIEWEEEFSNKNKITQKRFKTYLSKNPNTSYGYSKDGSYRLFKSKNSDCFQMEVTPKICSKCNVSKNKVNSRKKLKSIPKYTETHDSKCEDAKSCLKQKKVHITPNQTLSVEIKDVKQKVLEVIESIATNTNVNVDLDTDHTEKISLMHKKSDFDAKENYEQKNLPSIQTTAENAQDGITFFQPESGNITSNNKLDMNHSKNDFQSADGKFDDEVIETVSCTSDRITVINNSENASTYVRDGNGKEDNNSSAVLKTKYGETRTHWTQLRNRIFCRENHKKENNPRLKGTRLKNGRIGSKSTREIYSLFCKDCKENERAIEASVKNKVWSPEKYHLSKQVQKYRDYNFPKEMVLIEKTYSFLDLQNLDRHDSKLSKKSQLIHDSGKVLDKLKRKLNQDELEDIKLLVKANPCAFIDLLENCSKNNNPLPIMTKHLTSTSFSQNDLGISNQKDKRPPISATHISYQTNLENTNHAFEPNNIVQIHSTINFNGNDKINSVTRTSNKSVNRSFKIEPIPKRFKRKNILDKIVSSIFGSKANHKRKISRTTKFSKSCDHQEGDAKTDADLGGHKQGQKYKEATLDDINRVGKPVEPNYDSNMKITCTEYVHSELQDMSTNEHLNPKFKDSKTIKRKAPFPTSKPILQTGREFSKNDPKIFKHKKGISKIKTSHFEPVYRKRSCCKYCHSRTSNMSVWKKSKSLKNRRHGRKYLRRCFSLENLNAFNKHYFL